MSKLDAAFKRELIRKIEKADFALEDAIEDIAYEALTEVLDKVKLQISVDIED